ncbi:MAG: helix-turn-helix transcriptional regulator [Curvibacter sp.]|nr:helix-turn-helix transcriptional regulator [Curvibacter sp.]
MYLSSRQLKAMSGLMQTLAEPYGEREIRARVARQVLDLLDAQYFASYVWQPGPGRFDQRIDLNMDPANLMRYECHFQFHDPITLKMQSHRRAVRATDVMPQADLMRTEFFNDFLARDGLHWGVNLYAWDGPSNIGDLRVWRDRRHGNFSDEDLKLLDLLRPALVTALRQAQTREPTAAPRRLAGPGGPPDPGAALSAREREVAELAALGLADKEIARRLGLSPATVRTHLDHVFRKLGVDRRGKLAHCLRD